MECDKFENLLIDELYGELDEVTSAAVRRHAAGCARCAGLLSGLRATRKVATLPWEEPAVDLEDRILAAVREQQEVLPFRARVATVVSRAGAWAMRPQTGVAAAFLVVVATSFVLVQQRAAAPRADVSRAEGAPVGAPQTLAATPTVAASAYALDGKEARYAHGVVAEPLPVRAKTMAHEEDQTRDDRAPAEKKDSEREVANAAAVAGATDLSSNLQQRQQAATGGGASASATDRLAAATTQAPSGDLNALAPCSSADVQRYEAARRAQTQTAASNEALARCYRARGDADKARVVEAEQTPVVVAGRTAPAAPPATQQQQQTPQATQAQATATAAPPASKKAMSN